MDPLIIRTHYRIFEICDCLDLDEQETRKALFEMGFTGIKQNITDPEELVPRIVLIQLMANLSFIGKIDKIAKLMGI